MGRGLAPGEQQGIDSADPLPHIGHTDLDRSGCMAMRVTE